MYLICELIFFQMNLRPIWFGLFSLNNFQAAISCTILFCYLFDLSFDKKIDLYNLFNLSDRNADLLNPFSRSNPFICSNMFEHFLILYFLLIINVLLGSLLTFIYLYPFFILFSIDLNHQVLIQIFILKTLFAYTLNSIILFNKIFRFAKSPFISF